MKKRPSFLRRLPALLLLAAGVSVAVLASREDGREKLSQFGEVIGKGVETAGTILDNARHFATDYVEQIQRRGDASNPSYPAPYHPVLHQQNGSQHQSEYSHTH